jgi:hypothetical protein
MALASLLVRSHPKQTWAFEHAMAHRGLTGGMAPLSDFSVLPYVLDPELDGGAWHLNHNQAHTDAFFQSPLGAFGPPIPAKHLVDMKFDQHGRTAWWTFENHHDHFVGAGVTVNRNLIFPFW